MEFFTLIIIATAILIYYGATLQAKDAARTDIALLLPKVKQAHIQQINSKKLDSIDQRFRKHIESKISQYTNQSISLDDRVTLAFEVSVLLYFLKHTLSSFGSTPETTYWDNFLDRIAENIKHDTDSSEDPFSSSGDNGTKLSVVEFYDPSHSNACAIFSDPPRSLKEFLNLCKKSGIINNSVTKPAINVTTFSNANAYHSAVRDLSLHQCDYVDSILTKHLNEVYGSQFFLKRYDENELI